MPIIKSAAKRMRQDSVRRERNRRTKDTLRSEIKTLVRTVEAGNSAKAKEQLRVAQSALSTAVKKRVLHKNTAARKLSSLQKLVNGAAGKARPKATAAKKAAPKKSAAKTTAKKAKK